MPILVERVDDSGEITTVCERSDGFWGLIDVEQDEDRSRPDDPQPLGLVTRASVRHAFDHYLCFVLDTDEGRIYQGDLDERGIGLTESAVSVGTNDSEVSATLTVADEAPGSRDGLRLIWHGSLACPTGEIGLMDTTGLILMYVRASDPAPVQIWGNAVPHPDELLVVVG